MTGAWDGLIVLGLLVILLVLGVRRLRRRVHIPWATGGIVVFFIFVVLMLWAWSNR
ncbi:hypothetical protein LG943_20450 [Streptomonospora sp. S1-112]|uniref:Uncharacterized protein n=2 Tax=Streptomonospora TaxID=104204 RepID=A0A853BQR4_9ACTN|nr:MULTISPECIES: hypothetical protein [Streptomonospora]MBV2363954.1 hypothetical protein [Streptomonospora nanhaiensis]MBX9388419.1 hypothetical protein [Streptomonospora nanhaiensis]MDA0566663.1 hypothetical protein [Streptomonospora mangrovi]NYI96732.1 hypothetical protein [Streptomonospora nanhaiensis]